jgi:hypothetical protein
MNTLDKKCILRMEYLVMELYDLIETKGGLDKQTRQKIYDSMIDYKDIPQFKESLDRLKGAYQAYLNRRAKKCA